MPSPPFILLPLRGFAESTVFMAVEFFEEGFGVDEDDEEYDEQMWALMQAYIAGGREALHVTMKVEGAVQAALMDLLNSEDDTVEEEMAKSPAKRHPEMLNASRRARDGLTRVVERLQKWVMGQQRKGV